MDPKPTYDPWELIVSALQGELSAAEELKFQEWLAASADNREMYDRLFQAWAKGLGDYGVYTQADTNGALEALRRKMEAARHGGQGFKPIPGADSRRVIRISWLAAVAAMILILAGAGWWFYAGKGSAASYATGNSDTKDISLADGTRVILQPQTRMEVEPGFNGAARTVRLVIGKASFDVVHMASRPFVVDMDGVKVEDIGTSFTLEKTVDSLRIAVSAGRIAVTQKKAGVSREMNAGDSFTLYTGMDSLRFDNAPLLEILAALEKRSGKRIQLTDGSVAQKRLTLNLDGESLESSLRVICASLNLEYALKEGVYVLEKKK
jgi:transmembrane sensor